MIHRTGARPHPALLAPVLLVLAFFVSGLILAALQSLGWLIPGSEGPTLAHYRALASDDELVVSTALTLGVATVSSIVAVAGGLGVALALRRLTRGRRAAYGLLQVPLAIPHLAIALTLMTVLAPSGLLARIAFGLGWVDGPADVPALVNDRYAIGVILAYAAKEIPFLATVATVLLVRLGDDHDAVARTLGATAWQRFRYVTLPLLAPGVSAATLIVFAYTFAAFETPFLLGRPYPAMLPVVAQRRYLDPDLLQRPGAIALALVLMLVAALAARAYLTVSNAAAGRDRVTVF